MTTAFILKPTRSPYSTETMEVEAIGTHVIISRLAGARYNLPMRLLFRVGNTQQHLEHIFEAEWIEIDHKRYNLEEFRQAKLCPIGLKIDRVKIFSRPSGANTWESFEIQLGSKVTLSIFSRHARIDRETGEPFVDAQGNRLLHATYANIVEARCELSLPY